MPPRRDQDAGGLGVAVGREPKYYRLKRSLIDDLIGALPAGAAIPPERILASRFETSRTTVRQALQELVAEGRLTRLHGSGTFVARPKVAQPLQLTSYTEDMHAQGLRPMSAVLDISTIPADAELADLLAVARRDPVVRIERLRLGDGDPMAIEATHLAAERYPDVATLMERYTSLYALLATEFNVEPVEAEETIETALASPREAAILQTEVGLPLLMLSRHSFDRHGTPIEWVRSLYRGDRYKFLARIKRPTS
jgi:GntR family transcriptional regulator